MLSSGALDPDAASIWKSGTRCRVTIPAVLSSCRYIPPSIPYEMAWPMLDP